MTGVETAAALSAAAAASGTAATAAATAATAATAITAAEAAALGLTAAEASAAAAAGMTAAEVAAVAAPAAAATGETTAGLLAAQGGAEFAPAVAAEGQAGLLGAQTAEFGAQGAQLTNAAADPALTQGMQQPWYQQAQGWLGEKPLGTGPTRGKMIMQGGQAMSPQQQQQAPAPQRSQGQFQPSAPSSPYANMQMPGGGQYLSMADFLRRYQG